MNNAFPFSKDIVLIGGGHAHALVLRQWGMVPMPGARLTVINPGPTAPYSGMLPGFVAGHYTRDDLDIDLVRLARFAGARLINGTANAVDRGNKLIDVSGHPPVAYDVASIDIGITSEMPALTGFAAHGIPAKPLGTFAARWDRYRAQARAPSVAVIGGGVAGAELALAMAHALAADGHAPDVSLIDRGPVLSAMGASARGKIQAAMTAQGITVIENADIAQVSEFGVHLTDGAIVAAEFVTGAAGARPNGWMADIGVEMHDGFIAVNSHLQSSDPHIFAVGDCAHLTDNPRPKAGVYAVRQAPVLYDNLRNAVTGQRLQIYTPQKDYLKLVSLGAKSALAERFGTSVAGPMLWRWKDHIDQTFMHRLNDLPPMPQPAVPAIHAGDQDLTDTPMCGGCGAKVGRGALAATLGDAFGDDAAVLKTGDALQVLTTDHLRSFWDDPAVMAQIAATHALGDIWAMGAQPQAATVNLILPRMSASLQARTLAEIMTAARDILDPVGAKIVGGHTSLGAELTIGFSMTGLCKAAPICLAGAKPNDRLILTKPLGSGTIMAAEMAGQAPGAVVAAALATMVQGQAKASALLGQAHAMTDVTGFGLAGHLLGICDASGVGADIHMTQVPLMEGALSLAQRGVRSSLFADNVAAASRISGPGGALFDLMFDPQTAGGLLAAVAADTADTICAQLQDAGYAAAIIGDMTDSADQIRMIG